MALTIDHSRIKTVDVVIGGEHYGVPLLSQLSVKDVNEMREAAKRGRDAEYEWGLGYIKRYIPEDVLDTLWMSDVVAIFDAIKMETMKDGANMGESQALQRS